jgi:hypothetical protein
VETFSDITDSVSSGGSGGSSSSSPPLTIPDVEHVFQTLANYEKNTEGGDQIMDDILASTNVIGHCVQDGSVFFRNIATTCYIGFRRCGDKNEVGVIVPSSVLAGPETGDEEFLLMPHSSPEKWQLEMEFRNVKINQKSDEDELEGITNGKSKEMYNAMSGYIYGACKPNSMAETDHLIRTWWDILTSTLIESYHSNSSSNENNKLTMDMETGSCHEVHATREQVTTREEAPTFFVFRWRAESHTILCGNDCERSTKMYISPQEQKLSHILTHALKKCMEDTEVWIPFECSNVKMC